MSRHMVMYQRPRKTYANKCVIRKPTKSPCSTPCISITTVLISIKLMYFMPSLYTTLHTKFKGNQLSNLQDTG